MYAQECWIHFYSDEKNLDVFERKVLRRICGLIEVGGVSISKYNFELYTLHKRAGIV
jgi:hypothetical protein